ncbi:hypothetical protein [Melissospora conviva]|uniref:hypothetical protein n=1 Tax=Melissospora conviva TaxID=3388432 RepID=UPI003B76A0E3
MTDDATTEVLDGFLDDLYLGRDRMNQTEIQRRAVVAELPAELMVRISALPEGSYEIEEVAEMLGTTPG